MAVQLTAISTGARRRCGGDDEPLGFGEYADAWLSGRELKGHVHSGDRAKRARRLGGVDELVLSLTARG